MNNKNLSFIKNKALLEFSADESYSIATYKIDSLKYDESIIEEIAIGQSVGAFDTKFVSENILKNKVAKIRSQANANSIKFKLSLIIF